MKKPKRVAFTSVTRNQIIDVFKLTLDPMTTEDDILKHLAPAEFQRLPLNDAFVHSLKSLVAEFLKNAFLEKSDHLRVLSQSRNTCQSENFLFAGVAEYSITSYDGLSELLVIGVKAGTEIVTAELQLFAHAATILRERLMEKRNTAVMAVLTNGELFKFYAIDDRDSSVCSSRVIFLNYRTNREFKSYTDLIEVGTWFR